MRKISVLLVALLFVTLVACKTTSTSNQATTTNPTATTAATTANNNESLVEAALADLTLTGLDQVTSRIVLPGKGLHNVSITWVSSNEAYITNAGVVTQPDHTVGNQTVTLTATLTLGDVTRTKQFTATVIALENPVNSEPTLIEKFDYTVGEYLDDQDTWTITKGGRTGVIVNSVPGNNLPTDEVIKFVENVTSDTHYERAIEVTDVTVLEFMFLQENEGAGVNLEFLNGSSRVFSVSTNRNNSFVYRNESNQEITIDNQEIEPGVWYKARIEIDVTNTKYKFFYYDYASTTNELVELTPDGGVSFPAGQSTVNMLRIRVKNAPIVGAATYYADFVVNKAAALTPFTGTNPNRTVGLGEITGIPATLNLTTEDTFTEATPVVKNRFNGNSLVKDTDYTVTVDRDGLDMAVPGTYTVTYTITNSNHADDVKEFETVVTVVSFVAPNSIESGSNSLISSEGQATLTFNFSKIEGKLYVVVLPTGSTAPTAEEIKNNTNAFVQDVVALTESMTKTIAAESDVYAVVHSDNGYSNVLSLLNVDTVYHIKTIEQLNEMANSGSSDHYVLDNDLDATGYTWISNTEKFHGTFDGKGYTISNLTITKTAGYGGIFNEIEDATIKNLVIRNMQMNQPGRGGLIAGQALNSTIENIKVYNSKVTASADSYAALLVGRVKSGVTNFSKIYVENSEVYSEGNYVGGLIGYLEGANTIGNFSDIHLNNLKVSEVNTSAQLVGGVIGRIAADLTITANINRVFANVNLSAGKNVGGIIGKSQGTANVTDAVVMGSFTSGNSNSAVIVGNGASTATNVWDAGVTGTSTSGQNVDEAFKVTVETISTSTWWETNVPNIFNSDAWEMVNGLPVLK